jgi:hypothetical protein
MNQPLRHLRQTAKVHVLQTAATWAVRTALNSSYRLATGQAPPTARERDVPLRRLLAWTAVSAGAIAVANVVVDRVVLRPALPEDLSRTAGNASSLS